MPEFSDLTGLGKLADSKLVNAIYEDALQGPSQQFGKTLADTMKGLRLFLLPIQYFATCQDRIERYLNRVRESVPEERQIEAKPSIALPVLLELRYMEEDSPITELYLNLLRRAIDRDRVDEAHPAFAKIIGQLCPDEVLILEYLSRKNVRIWYHCTIEKTRWNFTGEVGKDCPESLINMPGQLGVLLSHLESLNLAGSLTEVERKPPDYVVADPGSPIVVKEHGLSEFGKLFIESCGR